MQLPGIDNRTLVIGRTGSGKTFAGLYLLSRMPIEDMPWLVIDFKKDQNIARIPYAQYVDVDTVPENPGVYIMQPYPDQDLENTLTGIWDRENIGLYLDEGAMPTLAKSSALNTIYIQGRSKHIPVITLTQRPVGISRFAFSEATFIQVFPSHDKRERKTIAEFTPLFREGDLDEHLLPEYHSYWYKVGDRTAETLKPVPSIEKILATFESKLRPPEPLEEVPQEKRRYTAI
jgi:hypothetical protein